MIRILYQFLPHGRSSSDTVQSIIPLRSYFSSTCHCITFRVTSVTFRSLVQWNLLRCSFIFLLKWTRFPNTAAVRPFSVNRWLCFCEAYALQWCRVRPWPFAWLHRSLSSRKVNVRSTSGQRQVSPWGPAVYLTPCQGTSSPRPALRTCLSKPTEPSADFVLPHCP